MNSPNLRLELIEGLSAAYHRPVSAEETFDAILCLLSARSYTTRFAEDLEDVFPHVPFPLAYDVFREAARIGAEIRAVETFARPPRPAQVPAGFANVASAPSGALGEVSYADGELRFGAAGRVTGVPLEVWGFSVSGYRVLPRWLTARSELPVDLAIMTELRDICGRIAELIALFAEADTVLEATLQATLTRAALGFGPTTPETHDEPD